VVENHGFLSLSVFRRQYPRSTRSTTKCCPSSTIDYWASATKITTTKINSDDFIKHSTEISTHEDNPLYGSNILSWRRVRYSVWVYYAFYSGRCNKNLSMPKQVCARNSRKRIVFTNQNHPTALHNLPPDNCHLTFISFYWISRYECLAFCPTRITMQ